MRQFKLLTLFLTLSVSINFANANGEKPVTNTDKLKIIDFNYSNEVDYNQPSDVFYDDNTATMIHVFSMQNSNDKLITYKNKTKNELVPIAFINYDNAKTIYKDINNRKDVLKIVTNFEGEGVNITYLEENDSNEGLALTQANCLGGSTLRCVQLAVIACDQDYDCSLMCRASGWRCPVAIATACAVACNNDFLED